VKHILTVLFLCASLCSVAADAASNNGVTAADKKVVAAALAKLSKTTGKTFTASDIKITPIHGLLQITADMNVFYVSKDGKYIISGEVIDLAKDKESWSLTEMAMRDVRKKALSEQDVKDMIVFPAKPPQLGIVTVFTDIDCQYCRKLQSHIKDYTDAGLEIRYMAFPRQGPGSPSFEKAITVWCSDNKPRDLTLAKEGKDLPKNLCKNKPVEKQFELGRRMGVNGTPTMFLENGTKFGGLMEPKELLKHIKEQAK